MMDEQKQTKTPLFLAVDIARENGWQLFDVLREVDKLGIEAQQVGNKRIFSAAQKEQIEQSLKSKVK